MELRHLRYFVAAAEAENVSRAATKLHLSQPALSRQIRDLEHELRFQLFERGAKSVRLTKAGRVFLQEARAVLQRAEAAVAAGRSAATSGPGELHLGYAPSPTARILPAALRHFQQLLPDMRVRLHDLSSEEMLAGLRDQSLHLALLVRPARSHLRGLHFEELTRDTMCLAISPHHSLARSRSVNIFELSQFPLLAFSRKEYPEYHEFLDTLFAKASPQILEEHDSHTSLIAAVESGAGGAIVAQSFSCYSGARLKFISIVPSPPPLQVGAVWAHNALTPAVETFLSCVRQAAKLEPAA